MNRGGGVGRGQGLEEEEEGVKEDGGDGEKKEVGKEGWLREGGRRGIKDGPGPVMVSDTLCPAVHILGT